MCPSRTWAVSRKGPDPEVTGHRGRVRTMFGSSVRTPLVLLGGHDSPPPHKTGEEREWWIESSQGWVGEGE